MKNWTLHFRQVDHKNFDEVANGTKSIETRAATIKYLPIEVGDTLTFVCGKDRLVKKVMKKYHWPSIEVMTMEIPFRRIMPSIASVDEMKKIYGSYPGYIEKIKEFGILGFELK